MELTALGLYMLEPSVRTIDEPRVRPRGGVGAYRSERPGVRQTRLRVAVEGRQ
jgi:hypothetical protein